jgi:hypothetical protein
MCDLTRGVFSEVSEGKVVSSHKRQTVKAHEVRGDGLPHNLKRQEGNEGGTGKVLNVFVLTYFKTCILCMSRKEWGKPWVCMPPAFTLGSCSAYSSTLKMETTCSSETSVDFKQTIRRYIPEDSTLHNHRSENLKSYILKIWSKFELDTSWIKATLAPICLVLYNLHLQFTEHDGHLIRR